MAFFHSFGSLLRQKYIRCVMVGLLLSQNDQRLCEEKYSVRKKRVIDVQVSNGQTSDYYISGGIAGAGFLGADI